MDQPGKVANLARGQLNRENNIPLSPCVPENLVSRDGFSRPVPRQPAHLHTQAESGVYLRDSSRVPRRRPFIYLNRHTPSGQSRVYRVTQLRTDDVHCRESAGTGLVNLKVVPNGYCLGRSSWTNLYSPLFSTNYCNTKYEKEKYCTIKSPFNKNIGRGREKNRSVRNLSKPRVRSFERLSSLAPSAPVPLETPLKK